MEGRCETGKQPATAVRRATVTRDATLLLAPSSSSSSADALQPVDTHQATAASTVQGLAKQLLVMKKNAHCKRISDNIDDERYEIGKYRTVDHERLRCWHTPITIVSHDYTSRTEYCCYSVLLLWIGRQITQPHYFSVRRHAV